MSEMEGDILTPFDINFGQCEEWARAAVASLRGGRIVWMDDFVQDPEVDQTRHAVFYYQGKYYDSQTLEGVEDYHDMAVFKHVPREQWLEGA